MGQIPRSTERISCEWIKWRRWTHIWFIWRHTLSADTETSFAVQLHTGSQVGQVIGSRLVDLFDLVPPRYTSLTYTLTSPYFSIQICLTPSKTCVYGPPAWLTIVHDGRRCCVRRPLIAKTLARRIHGATDRCNRCANRRGDGRTAYSIRAIVVATMQNMKQLQHFPRLSLGR